MSGRTVTLEATPDGGTTLTQPSVTTDADGKAPGTLSSSVAGVKVISATIAETEVEGTAQVRVNPGPIDAAKSTVEAESPITAGSGVSVITVTARDGNSNPISGATVTLQAPGAGNPLTQPGDTDADGEATGTLRSSVA